MNVRWKIHDIIDLEHYLHTDQAAIDSSIKADVEARDRRIYLNDIQPELDQTNPFPRRFVIHLWLKKMRLLQNTSGLTASPGLTYRSVLRLARFGLFIVGGLTGIVLAISLLGYTGTAPLNVSVYIGVAVLTQILLVVLLGLYLLLRLFRPRLFYTSPLYLLLSRFVILIMKKIKTQAENALPGTVRSSLAEALGLVRGKKQVYGSLFYWPIFNAFQMFGIGFNIGMLGATLLRVIGTDMAFGWQSTVQVSATAVHTLVKWLAIPWSWFISPDLAHPTLSQIEGSRLVLKEGIMTLSTPDLVAWWPFLCLAVLFYGLIPRLALMILGQATQRRLLRKIPFTHAVCDRLVDRLTLPYLNFESITGHREPSPSVPPSNRKPIERTTSSINKQFAVLIPEDLFDTCDTIELSSIINSRFGGEVAMTIRLDFIEEISIADQLEKAQKSSEPWTHLLLIQEAWQPPIIEDMAYFTFLRDLVGKNTPIIIGLIGKPTPHTIFTGVSSTNRATWRTKLTSLGDPHLRMEDLHP